jgi:hypothetical protein
MADGLGNGLEQVKAFSEGIIGTGSPTSFDLSIQTGTVQASNVAVTASFGTAFSAAPKVNVTLAVSGAAASHPGAVTGAAAGSFTFLGQSGLDYSYTAIGTGNL